MDVHLTGPKVIEALASTEARLNEKLATLGAKLDELLARPVAPSPDDRSGKAKRS